MKRLIATMQMDARLQFRNGFYYAAAFLVLAWAIIIPYLPPIDWPRLLPPLILGNLSMATFYFIGGMVLLEKGEGTLQAQIVTPLTAKEYLASKIITLSLLSVVENLAIALLAAQGGVRWYFLAGGILVSSAVYCLTGFVAVARYNSINEYLLPSMLYVVVLSLPFLNYFGLWDTRLMYLHPLQAPLLILKASTHSITQAEWLYSLLSSALWILLTFRWALHYFNRFVVAEQGIR